MNKKDLFLVAYGGRVGSPHAVLSPGRIKDPHGISGRLPASLSNRLLMPDDRTGNAAISPTAMKVAIRLYSMALAPDSSRRNRFTALAWREVLRGRALLTP